MLRRRRIRAASAVAVAGFLILGGIGPASADPQADKARVDRELTQARATYESASDAVNAAVAAYNEAERRLSVARDTLTDANGGVADPRYAAALAQVGQANTQVGALVADGFKIDGPLALDREAGRQQQALNGYLNAQVTAKAADNVTIGAQQRADAAAQTARRALAAALAAEAKAVRAAGEVVALQAAQAQAITAANAQRDATLAQYQELRVESDRLAARLRQLATIEKTPATVTPWHGAYLLTPVQGWKSSDFGMRLDPYYKVWQLHAGVDLAAAAGTPIYAAADGQVLRAGWNGGNGNYTCISHGLYQGQNLTTCYAHQSAILVSVGQSVHRGQLIGRVGSTGASTGAHLHFEVRMDGTPVQPLNWLDDCLC